MLTPPHDQVRLLPSTFYPTPLLKNLACMAPAACLAMGWDVAQLVVFAQRAHTEPWVLFPVLHWSRVVISGRVWTGTTSQHGLLVS